MNCQAEYYITKLNFPRLKKCKNRAKVERSGIHYCLLHDPEKRKQKNLIRKRDKNESRNH